MDEIGIGGKGEKDGHPNPIKSATVTEMVRKRQN